MTYRWTNDPADPCPYCVQWVEPEQMDSSNFDKAVPITPNGPAERVFMFTHDSCEAAVSRHVAEQIA